MTADQITDSYQVDGEDMLTLIADAVHRIDHRTADMDARLRKLEADWAAFKPIAEGFSRGGILGARAAAKNGRHHAVPQG